MITNSPKPPMPPPLPKVAAAAMPVEFVGERGALFWLALKTGFYTILTLGFYRFWMKTRLRRWYWSSIRPGGTPMEYVGDPWEKLLGFFIAVVILTFYIGIVNLILMFISFSVFQDSWVGYLSSFVGVIPLWFYATYRARRYVLGRTRWRGVRFALEPAAWAFTWRALIHWLVTICTAGLLWPRMTFYLEKFRTDRTFFGSARLHQGGKWWMLYRALVPFLTLLVLSAIYILWITAIDPVLPPDADLDKLFASYLFETEKEPVFANNPERLFLAPLIPFFLFYGVVNYRFASKQIMANHKSAEGIALVSNLKPPRITLIYIFGTFLAYLILLVGLIVLVFAAAALFGSEVIVEEQFGDNGPISSLPKLLSVAIFATMYLGIFLLWGVLYNAFVTYPLMRHMATTVSIENTSGFSKISQRKRDEFAEAEGFAEALDLGAAI